MFIDVVTVEQDATVVADKEDVMILSTRVSYRTRNSFQSIKDGKSEKSYTQFVDATIFARKSKDFADKNISAKDLTKGTKLFVMEGDIGTDVLPSKKNAGEKMYFTKLVISRFSIQGRRESKDISTTPQPTTAVVHQKEEVLSPRTPVDEGDKVSNDLYF